MSPEIHLSVRLPLTDFALAVDLRLPASGITVLFGPSGSGKTSLLRCVAGLTQAPQAHIALGGQCWQDTARGHWVPPWQRPIGMVFQEASLFDHLSVRDNVAFGLRRLPAALQPAARGALEDAIALLGIGELMSRGTAHLSGGERQRVAIARALATQPSLLLLDEPLASIDPARRGDILPWLERLRDELSLPMLYVTHSVDELARLASHVVALERGQVRTSGDAASMFSRLDAPLLQGDEAGALLPGRIVARDATWHLARVDVPGGSLWVRDEGWPVDHPVRLRVLARDVSVVLQRPLGSSIQNLLPATLESLADDTHPAQLMLSLRCAESRLLARVTRRAAAELGLQPGQTLWAQVKAVALLPSQRTSA